MTEMAGMQANSAPHRADGEAFLNQLRATFAKMPNDIPLFLFTEKGRDDVFAQANRQVIRAFRELTDKITLKEFDLSHELARQYGVTAAPTLVMAPDRFNIHWIGAPMGEESSDPIRGAMDDSWGIKRSTAPAMSRFSSAPRAPTVRSRPSTGPKPLSRARTWFPSN